MTDSHNAVTANDVGLGCVNLLEEADAEISRPVTPNLAIAVISEDEKPYILFTQHAQHILAHYVDEPGINGYAQCNNNGCVLCKAGKNKRVMYLLPVYSMLEQRVVLLRMSDDRRPRSLKPQLVSVLRSPELSVVFIRKADNYTFNVTVSPLAEGVYAGEREITAFNDDVNGGHINLADAVPRIPNDELLQMPGISTCLQLKGGLDGRV